MKLELKAKLLRTFPKAKTIGSGRLFTRQLSYLVDSSLISLYQNIDQEIPMMKHLALVPIGGYGRMELAPYSDIDLLYLHDGKLSNYDLTEIIARINTYLYNNEREVGHACRTIKESFLSMDNIQSYHAILDSRFLIGSKALYQDYKNQFLDKLPKDRIKEYNEWKLDFLKERIINSYNPLLLSEPNLKNDSLGLRDIQLMYWIEKTYTSPSQREGGVFDYFLNGDTLPIVTAYDFLLRSRTALHILSGRKNDRLDLNYQSEVAEFLGFGSKVELSSIEKFMSVLYKHQKDVYFYLGMYLEKKTSPSLDHYTRHFSNPDTFYDDIMHFFLECQLKEIEPSRIILNDLRFASHFIDDDFKNSGPVIDTFLQFVRNRKRVGHLLTLMHECNILGKLIPEFGACSNFPLFSYHHEYTVDEHTLLILRELDKLEEKVWEDPQVQAVFNDCQKIDILVLAILIHDAGKVKEGDHCQYGAELALIIAERFRFSEEDTELLRFLVAEHIIMSDLSSKRDIYDPKLIQSFSQMFTDANTLRLLYVMTIIDTKSVGKGVLTNWKKEILFFLFSATLKVLEKATNLIDSNERIEQTLEVYLQEKEGLEPEIAAKIVNFAAEIKPSSYLNYNTPRRVFQHFVNIVEWKNMQIPFRFISESEPAFITVTIFSEVNRQLLLFVSGTISSLGLNLVGMRLFRSENDIIIIQSQITDQFGSGAIAPEQIQNIEKMIADCVSGKVNIEEESLTEHIWSSPPKIPDGMVEELVKFSNDQSDSYSVLEIRVPDSIGLVYRILKTLLDFDLDVIFVRISTSADFAYDSFYIQTSTGQKLEDSEILFSLKEKILEVARMKQNQGIFEISF
ncbi:HD domain-containing protein [Leptospira ilyithenensis]|uniref:Bifunctional uridylyltransferase/uridylyl-removing enzyme n=1 Tax=Leptospira ilyithenensis TaxID=2484901 RepID=A0A4R9LP96_9LEPT|nr:HD domain-containing protein [Leptospira ilyithenensis]TGN10905.1 HD domain-containing protein [Leptospira ilyithenensis]